MKNTISTFLVLFLAVQAGQTQEVVVSPALKQKVKKAAMELHVYEPNPMDPLSLNATMVWSEDKSQVAVIMKALLLDGWHIYAHVPSTQPYIASELQLELPEGVSAIGTWETPSYEAYDNAIYVYSGELIFVRYCSVKNNKEISLIKTGLYYQSCDLYKCFPPKTKTKDLKLITD